MTAQQAFDIIKRDAATIYSEEGLHKKLTSGKKLRIKYGADPSRPDLHLGHTVALRKLRLLQNLGHEIIFLIGDFTGMIGDPSGKSKTRTPLTFEETRANAQTYLKQLTKIIDKDKTRVVYNSDWLSKMNFADVLKLAGKYTVARIMERDDFAKRYSENHSIGLHEIFYPLMQGYDSVELHADIEIGGTDQTFNMLVGRELQKDYGQESQEVITFPIIAGLDGVQKMSKSLDNYIGIDEEPGVMFEKCMKVPDSILYDYFRLTTDISEEIFSTLIKTDIRRAHFEYANYTVGFYHSPQAAEDAQKRYNRVASGQAPDSMTVYKVDMSQYPSGIKLTELVKSVGFTSSMSEARRGIAGRGVRIDGVVIEDVDMIVTITEPFVLQFGKNKFVRVMG